MRYPSLIPALLAATCFATGFTGPVAQRPGSGVTGVVTVSGPAAISAATATLPRPGGSQLIFDLTARRYSGVAQPVAVSPKAGVGAVTAVFYSGARSVPVKPGTYKISVNVAAGAKYAARTGLVLGNFRITPATPTKTQFSYDLTARKYSGAAQTVKVTPVAGVGAVKAVYYNGSKSAPINVGTYQVSVDVAAGAYYTAATRIVLGEYRIIAATPVPPTTTQPTATPPIVLPTANPTVALPTANPIVPTPVATRLNGIDVSKWNPDYVIQSVPSDFVIIRASGGIDEVDATVATKYQLATQSGKLVALYHRAHAELGNSPEAEADAFVAVAKKLGAVGKAVLVLDHELESQTAGGAGWALRFLNRVKATTGVTPIIYGSVALICTPSYATVAANYPLWVAEWIRVNGALEPINAYRPTVTPRAVTPWKAPTIYQYTSIGRLPGYDGDLDLDVFYGSKADWQNLAKINN